MEAVRMVDQRTPDASKADLGDVANSDRGVRYDL